MTNEDLANFLDDPVAYLGTNGLRIFPPGSGFIKASKQPLRVDYVGLFSWARLPAQLHTHQFKLASNQRTLEVHANEPGRQCQRMKAFYLPWGENSIYVMQLTNCDDVNLFFTAQLNGCCVYIAGDAASPYVIHANLSTDDLEDIDLTGLAPLHAGAVLRRHQIRIYDRNYWALLGALQRHGVIPCDVPVTLFDPGTYFARGGSRARLFGVKKDGAWHFFTNTETEMMTGQPPQPVHITERLAIP